MDVSKLLKSLDAIEFEMYSALKDRLDKAGTLLGTLSTEIVPVWSGELRASQFMQEEETPQGPSVIVGFSADHAILIHESLNRPPGYKPEFPEQQSKFLEKPFRENHQLLIDIISGEAK